MLRRVLMLGLVSLGAVAIAPSASANQAPVCPYFLGDSGMTDEQIIAWCEDWEDERRVGGTPRGSREFDGKKVTRGIHPSDFNWQFGTNIIKEVP